MKKAYVTPTVEKVEFQYDKVVVASGAKCQLVNSEVGNSVGECNNGWISKPNNVM